MGAWFVARKSMNTVSKKCLVLQVKISFYNARPILLPSHGIYEINAKTKLRLLLCVLFFFV